MVTIFLSITKLLHVCMSLLSSSVLVCSGNRDGDQVSLQLPSCCMFAWLCSVRQVYSAELKFDTDTRVDFYWAAVTAMTNKITRTARVPLLTRVTRAIYCVPNSNADCESFSMSKLIHIEHRTSLDNSTLCAC